MQNEHERYMARCLQLATLGLYDALPNPSVGAVVVHQGRIIGEGATAPYGGDHAEVRALKAVQHPELLPEAILYVSLEPCSHFGKTPPCADLIIRSGITEVVIGMQDPFAAVAGTGIAKLKQAGLKVTVGVLETACATLNKRFLCLHQRKRPYVILKWAASLDGFLAPEQQEAQQVHWISNPHSQQLVHQWRSEEMAFLVGTQTALKDNPSLTTRSWFGKNPLRLFIDRLGLVPDTHALKDGSTPTWCFTAKADAQDRTNLRYMPLDFESDVIQQILDLLHAHQIASLVVEGGAQTLARFIAQELWDEARVFEGNTLLHQGIKAPALTAVAHYTKQSILDDTLFTYHS